MVKLKLLFLPEFKQMKVNNAALKKENDALKIQLHCTMEKVEAMENKTHSKNLIIKNTYLVQNVPLWLI